MLSIKTLKRIQTFWMDNLHYTFDKMIPDFVEDNQTHSKFSCFKTSYLFQNTVDANRFQIKSHSLYLKVLGRNGQVSQIHLQPFYVAVQWLDKLTPEERFHLFVPNTHGYPTHYQGYSFLFKNSNNHIVVVVVVYLVNSQGRDYVIVFVDEFQHRREWFVNIQNYLQKNGFHHGLIQCLYTNTAPFLNSTKIY